MVYLLYGENNDLTIINRSLSKTSVLIQFPILAASTITTIVQNR